MAILINDTSPFVRYVATAGQTLFTVPFEFFDEADLVVELNGTVLTYSVTPANATQYSVTGANQEGGGSITLGAPGASLNDVVLIYSNIAIERNANYPETGPMAIASLNQEQARHIAIMKQLKRDIDRAIKAALGANGINIDYDSLADGDALIWDAATETLIGAVIATSDNTYIIGGTDVAIADGGTGASTAPQARINLGLGTAATLDTDTDTTLAANSDTKIATQKAVKAYVDANAGSATALDNLTDVTITAPSSGQVIKYNGSAWVNDTDATGGGSGTDMFGASRVYRAAYGKFNATTTSDVGLNLTATGTNVLTTFATTSLLTSLSRSSRSTGTTAEAYAGWRDADFAVIRRNGFKLSIVFGVPTIAGTDTRVFAGLTSDSLLNTDEDPVDFDHILGFALDAADSNWQRMVSSGTSGAAKTDTGIALTAGDLLEAVIECDAGGSSVTMTLYQWTGTSRTVAATYGPATVSSGLPADTQSLYPYLWINNNGASAASIIDLVAMKILT